MEYISIMYVIRNTRRYSFWCASVNTNVFAYEVKMQYVRFEMAVQCLFIWDEFINYCIFDIYIYQFRDTGKNF